MVHADSTIVLIGISFGIVRRKVGMHWPHQQRTLQLKNGISSWPIGGKIAMQTEMEGGDAVEYDMSSTDSPILHLL